MKFKFFDNLTSEEHTDDYLKLYDILRKHHKQVVKTFHNTHSHAKKLFAKHSLALENLRHAGAKATAGAALASSLFIAPAYSSQTANLHTEKHVGAQIPAIPDSKIIRAGPQNPEFKQMTQAEFAHKIREIMGSNIEKQGTLSPAQLDELKTVVKQQFNIEINAKTDSGFELKDHYGMMGREQHLPRHPGDTAAAHVSKFDPLAILSGITPKNGAFGYVSSAEETWYCVGQTFLSDQFGTAASKNLGGQDYLIIQIPPENDPNQTTVIKSALEDSGPGRSTGKVFGGSPEMFYLLGDAAGRSSKAQVIMLPMNKISPDQTGPIDFAK